jgi:hypothetical protein
MIRVELEDGSVVTLSGPHPTADGRRIVARTLVAYDANAIVDILPDTDSGTYFISNVQLGSTLTPRGAHALLSLGTQSLCSGR